MSNETYLKVSYVAFGLLSLGMAATAIEVLRAPLRALADSIVQRRSAGFLKRVQPVLFVLVAGAGFFGVSYNYTGCGVLSYEQVVKDRPYLVKTNRQQVRSTAVWLAGGVLTWTAIVAVCAATARRTHSERKEEK